MNIFDILQGYRTDKDLSGILKSVLLALSSESCVVWFGMGEDAPALPLDGAEVHSAGVIATLLDSLSKRPYPYEGKLADSDYMGVVYPDTTLDTETMNFTVTSRAFVTDWVQTVVGEKAPDGHIRITTYPYPIIRKEMIPC